MRACTCARAGPPFGARADPALRARPAAATVSAARGDASRGGEAHHRHPPPPTHCPPAAAPVQSGPAARREKCPHPCAAPEAPAPARWRAPPRPPRASALPQHIARHALRRRANERANEHANERANERANEHAPAQSPLPSPPPCHCRARTAQWRWMRRAAIARRGEVRTAVKRATTCARQLLTNVTHLDGGHAQHHTKVLIGLAGVEHALIHRAIPRLHLHHMPLRAGHVMHGAPSAGGGCGAAHNRAGGQEEQAVQQRVARPCACVRTAQRVRRDRSCGQRRGCALAAPAPRAGAAVAGGAVAGAAVAAAGAAAAAGPVPRKPFDAAAL